MNKVIFMCYKNLKDIEIHSKNWIKLNPDWKIRLFDDKLCKEFLLLTYGDLFVNIFDFIKDGPIKADFWRLCILYKYGGLYVDADIEPLIPLNKYLTDTIDFATCLSSHQENRGRFPRKTWNSNPHFIYCKHPYNKLIKSCICLYVSMFQNEKPYSYWTWSITGVFNQQINLLHQNNSGIIFYKNMKILLLQEVKCQYCEFGNIKVLNNRYENYKNHQFIKND